MSRKVRQQLAEIRKQVTKDEIARMRAHVTGRRKVLTDLEQRRQMFERMRRNERRARLAHLRNPGELAWWRRNKAQILREAKAADVTEPDAIAERVREATEAELRKQGYAA